MNVRSLLESSEFDTHCIVKCVENKLVCIWIVVAKYIFSSNIYRMIWKKNIYIKHYMRLNKYMENDEEAKKHWKENRRLKKKTKLWCTPITDHTCFGDVMMSSASTYTPTGHIDQHIVSDIHSAAKKKTSGIVCSSILLNRFVCACLCMFLCMYVRVCDEQIQTI